MQHVQYKLDTFDTETWMRTYLLILAWCVKQFPKADIKQITETNLFESPKPRHYVVMNIFLEVPDFLWK